MTTTTAVDLEQRVALLETALVRLVDLCMGTTREGLGDFIDLGCHLDSAGVRMHRDLADPAWFVDDDDDAS